MEGSFSIRSTGSEDLPGVTIFLQPFMDEQFILPRTSVELELLLRHSFIAESDDKIVGFAAIEVYSKKLAEIQCLAVSKSHRRRGVGRQLVAHCVQRAKDEKVREVMAITATEALFQDCGFDYALPGQKRALFVQTND
jgi:N-acetylglutamate synthase-like GNAT family acetyltransferase